MVELNIRIKIKVGKWSWAEEEERERLRKDAKRLEKTKSDREIVIVLPMVLEANRTIRSEVTSEIRNTRWVEWDWQQTIAWNRLGKWLESDSERSIEPTETIDRNACEKTEQEQTNMSLKDKEKWRRSVDVWLKSSRTNDFFSLQIERKKNRNTLKKAKKHFFIN
jgi:hypothetical protein